MPKFTTAFVLTALAASTSVYAAPADVLDANRTAMGGAAWNGKLSVTVEYAYSGQGLTGKVTSRADLGNGDWSDNFALGPMTGAQGFDGAHAWAKDQSGTVTQQDGGDQRQLAINEGYRRANLWWRADRGGAGIVDDGEKSDGGRNYDVLTITPQGGKPFDAWFDAQSHLLARLVEKQGPQTVTTTLSDYRPIDSVEAAVKTHISSGEAKYDQDLTLVAANFGPALDQAAFAAPKVTVADFAIAGGKDTTFPFHLVNNHIYADVGVNGKGPFQFIFDTGGTNLVTPALATDLGLKTEGQMQGGGAGSGHVDVGVTKVTSLQLGNATIKDQAFAVMALDKLSPVEGVPMPGMVGFETFRRFVTRIDYGNRTITLMLPDAFDSRDAGEAIPFTFNGNTIEVTAGYDGVKGNFTIDTGSRSSVTLNGPFVADNHLNTTNKSIDSVTGWGIGGATRGVTMHGDTLQIGSATVQRPISELSTDKGGAFADASIAGNIGAGILKRYIVTFDYEHTTMYLKPVTHAVADLDTFDRAGMWFNVSGDGFAVVDVTAGAPADQAGLKVGDVIVTVDGKPTADLKLYDVRQKLRDEAPGTVVNFTVMRGSESKNIAVTLRDLI
jgi:hypothetical protein